jgi:hypothetical protein
MTTEHNTLTGAALHNSKILTFTGAPASYTPPESGIIVSCLTSPNAGKLYRTTGTTAGAVSLLAAGVDGAAATVSIGDVTASAGASPAVVVTDSGTATDAILDFDFTLVAGEDGAGYGGTSTSTLAIASSGSISVTTQAGLAYVVGSRVRLASSATPTNWMEGVVTSYSSTTLVFTADLSNGSGTISSWTLSIAGVRGATGADGRTILNGSGAPSGGTGANGDFYLDTTADAIYGPKTAGSWGSPTSLIGPTGSVSSASGLTLDPVSTPSAPGTGIILYTKTGDLRPYYRPAGGAETLIGTGSGGGLEVLAANRTYYVNVSTGSDSNDGLSSGAAFATYQKAFDTLSQLINPGYTITVQGAASQTVNLTSSIVVKQAIVPQGGGSLLVDFNGSTLQSSSGTNTIGFGLIIADGVRNVTLKNGKSIMTHLSQSFSTNVQMQVRSGAKVDIDGWDWGGLHTAAPAFSYQLLVESNAELNFISNYSISGGYDGSNTRASHIYARGGGIVAINGTDVAISNTPKFNIFLLVEGGASVSYFDSADTGFTGSVATGCKKYEISGAGTVNTYVSQGGAVVFPGSVAGTESSALKI